MTITELGDLLRAQPMPWRDIPAELREIAAAALLPAGGFSEQQRAWLDHWRLACTAADVSAINEALPEAVRVAPVAVAGALYLGSDLLTDAITPGGTYHAALPVLEALMPVWFDTPPQPDDASGI